MLQAFLLKVRAHVKRLRGAVAYPADPVSAARLQEEQFAAVRHNTPGMMAANVCNALVLLATFVETPLVMRAGAWSGAVLAVSFYIFARSWRRGRARAATEPTSVGRRAVAYAFALGSLWAAVPVLFFLEASPGARMMVISLTAGMLFGGAFSLARTPLAATVFATPIALAATFTLLGGRDPDLNHIAIVLWVYLCVLLRGVFVEAANFKERVLAQIGVEREARTDTLTRLPNRLAFSDAIEREFARQRRHGVGFLLLCVDLDDFKTVNDRYGHLAGDELLQEAGRRMRAALRLTDVVARLGGDEFAVIATDVSSEEAAITLADRIIGCFDAPFVLDGVPVRSSASVGGARAPRDGSNPRELMKRADAALYEAKSHGDCWRVVEIAQAPQAGELRALEQDLRRVFSLDQLTQAYAPVLDVATGRIVGCEAKLLWRHPTRGDVAPARFLPIAGRIGRAEEIGLWVLEEACMAAAQLNDECRVAINVSQAQMAWPDFAERLLESLTRADVAPRRIAIKINDTALLARQPGCDESVVKLSRAGVCVTLDNIGSDASSLAMLHKLPLDSVRIGGAFVCGLPERKDCVAIAAGMARMAAELGLSVAAEGVDSMAQFEWLRANGCREVQGDLVAAPMTLQELCAFVRAWRPERLAAAPGRLERRA